MVETKKSFCRFCHAFCPIEVDVEDNKVIEVRGDTSNPIYGGYTCIKGRHLPDQHNHPDRIRTSMKRMPDGSFQPISSRAGAGRDRGAHERDHRGARAPLGGDVQRHVRVLQRNHPLGVASLARRRGVALVLHERDDRPAGKGDRSVAPRHLDGRGPRVRHGRRGDAHRQQPGRLDVRRHPPVQSRGSGLRDAQKRGLKLIVIDPRSSDVAKRADLHLQVRPGEDPTLLAGIIKVMFDEGLVDGDFLAGNAAHVEELQQAVDSFEMDYVEERTGVPAALVERAARMFAEAQRGVASSGTGANMAPAPEPDRALRPDPEHALRPASCVKVKSCQTRVSLARSARGMAQANPPNPAWGKGEPSRVRGLGEVFGEMPTAALSDEIITPGEGRVRALVSVGGNPVGAWPDQLKTIEAMKQLDLNVRHRHPLVADGEDGGLRHRAEALA